MVRLNREEVAAIAWIIREYAEPGVELVEVEAYVDPAQVGWLRVTVPQWGSNPQASYKVSPRGRVFNWRSMDLLREGAST